MSDVVSRADLKICLTSYVHSPMRNTLAWYITFKQIQLKPVFRSSFQIGCSVFPLAAYPFSPAGKIFLVKTPARQLFKQGKLATKKARFCPFTPSRISGPISNAFEHRARKRCSHTSSARWTFPREMEGQIGHTKIITSVADELVPTFRTEISTFFRKLREQILKNSHPTFASREEEGPNETLTFIPPSIATPGFRTPKLSRKRENWRILRPNSRFSLTEWLCHTMSQESTSSSCRTHRVRNFGGNRFSKLALA